MSAPDPERSKSMGRSLTHQSVPGLGTHNEGYSRRERGIEAEGRSYWTAH